MEENEEKGDVNLFEAYYPAESTVGDQAFRQGMALSESPLDNEALRELIAEKAFELYLKRGQIHGHDVEDWLGVEQLVLGELKIKKRLILWRSKIK